MITPVVVVHGGAGRIAPEHALSAKAGVGAAVEAARAVLRSGGDAEAAVVAAVRVLEDDPTYNAGRGACMNELGEIELDAGIMRGDGRSGAVAAVPDVGDAILLAQAVMHDGRHRILAGAGAVRFATAQGVGTFGRDRVWTPKAQARWENARRDAATAPGQADTVGAVVLDGAGLFCVGCSTGGVLLKRPGRVGDSPIVGAGYFASASLGAACATGMGEAILATVASYEVLRRIAEGAEARVAAADVCRETAGSNATCGLILVTADGRPVVAHESDHMSWALAIGDAAIESGVQAP
jgi:beta-aspartyl-peptidase (threonine type)